MSFYLKKIVLGIMALGVFASSQLMAKDKDESQVMTEIQEKLSKEFGVPVDAVDTTNYENLYEVQLQGNLIYTNKEADYIMLGQLVDVKTKADLTAERMEAINKIDIDELPLDKSIKRVYGDGTHKVVTFEDPYCPYCKKMTEELVKLKDVTIYTFMIPVIKAESFPMVENIWCADDPAQAWDNWMLKSKEPKEQSCEHPAEENMNLAQELKVSGTPVTYFENGLRLNGYVPYERIKSTMEKE